MTKTLASQHHKSICQVESSLLYGHALFYKRQEKISAWNVFFWKKCQSGHSTNNENSMFIPYGAAHSDNGPNNSLGSKTIVHDLIASYKEVLQFSFFILVSFCSLHFLYIVPGILLVLLPLTFFLSLDPTQLFSVHSKTSDDITTLLLLMSYSITFYEVLFLT